MAGDSLLAALIVNFLIGVMKLTVGILTASAAMVAEAYHSFADTFNQILLALGIRNSKKAPDLEHPFGYQKNQFFWSLIVAILIFGVSGILAFIKGWEKIREGVHGEEETSFLWNIVVLLIAIVLEGFALRTAFREARLYKEKLDSKNMLEAFDEMQDPVLLSLLVEDTLAITGLIVALIGVIITIITENPLYDGITSMVIGVILMTGGLLLAKENKTYLIGKAVTHKIQKQIKDTIHSLDSVVECKFMKTMRLGPKDMILALDIVFEEGVDIPEEIDKLEKKLITAVPELKAEKIFIEAQD